MTETLLSSGWWSLHIGPRFVAQLPPGFAGERIPDEYIFQPEWNRDMANAWWKSRSGHFIKRVPTETEKQPSSNQGGSQ